MTDRDRHHDHYRDRDRDRYPGPVRKKIAEGAGMRLNVTYTHSSHFSSMCTEDR